MKGISVLETYLRIPISQDKKKKENIHKSISFFYIYKRPAIQPKAWKFPVSTTRQSQYWRFALYVGMRTAHSPFPAASWDRNLYAVLAIHTPSSQKGVANICPFPSPPWPLMMEFASPLDVEDRSWIFHPSSLLFEELTHQYRVDPTLRELPVPENCRK